MSQQPEDGKAGSGEAVRIVALKLRFQQPSLNVSLAPQRFKRQVSTWQTVAILALIFAVACGAAMIGLAVALANELKKNDSTTTVVKPTRSSVPSAADQVTFPPRVADVFTPFVQTELDEIALFVQKALSLSESEPEDMNGDWIYALDFLPDDKQRVLSYIDGPAGVTWAGRYARATVYHLKNASNATVIEYRVGPIARFPLPASTAVTPLAQGGTLGASINVPYYMRPISDAEYTLMETPVADAMTILANLSLASYGETYDQGNFWWTDSAPRGYLRANRQTWIWFMWCGEKREREGGKTLLGCLTESQDSANPSR